MDIEEEGEKKKKKKKKGGVDEPETEPIKESGIEIEDG
jgi:hypothetical protein